MSARCASPETKTRAITLLNDAFRRSFVGGLVVLTDGVAALPNRDRAELLAMIRSFAAFDADNDPHAEHDFGAIGYAESKYFWKIDYYDRSMMFGSLDPADPRLTTRVLTIMRADEY